MGERSGKGKPEQQDGQIARLNLALLDIQITYTTGTRYKLALFLWLLSRRRRPASYHAPDRR